jgi:hypothetical protein
LPWCFSSQQCESYYKALRSFTPVGSTQTNFIIGEVITSRGWKVKTGKNIFLNWNNQLFFYNYLGRCKFDSNGGRRCARHHLPKAYCANRTAWWD